MKEHPATHLARLAYWLACISALALPLFTAAQVLRPSHRQAYLANFAVGVVVNFGLVGALLGGGLLFWASRQRRSFFGKANAIAAAMVGVCSAAVFGVLFPVFAQTRGSGTAYCLSNEKQLGLALTMYEQDWDGKLPMAADWNHTTFPYVKNTATYRCPEEGRQNVPSYGLNVCLVGLYGDRVYNSSSLVMIFDSSPGRDMVGTAELLPSPPRHREGHNITFLDGHAKWVGDTAARKLDWAPALAPPWLRLDDSAAPKAAR